MIKHSKFKLNTGFTLLEVLIALVILAIGLLGIAGLQLTGLMNNNSAAQRSQATALASEFADILRSNQPQVLLGKFSKINTASLGYKATPKCKTIKSCTSAQMAERDLIDWGVTISQLLPQGSATSARVGDVYTVTITWLDDKGLDDKENNKPKSFQTSFRP